MINVEKKKHHYHIVQSFSWRLDRERETLVYGYIHVVFILTRHHATIFLRYDGRITFLQKV